MHTIESKAKTSIEGKAHTTTKTTLIHFLMSQSKRMHTTRLMQSGDFCLLCDARRDVSGNMSCLSWSMSVKFGRLKTHSDVKPCGV
jgi:hypothetical protein